MNDPSSAYRADILDGQAPLRPDQLHGMLVMRDQVFKIGMCLDQSDPWTALTESYPELARISEELSIRNRADRTHVGRQFLQLLRTYVSECQCFTPLAPR